MALQTLTTGMGPEGHNETGGRCKTSFRAHGLPSSLLFSKACLPRSMGKVFLIMYNKDLIRQGPKGTGWEPGAATKQELQARLPSEIGRASCRERV